MGRLRTTIAALALAAAATLAVTLTAAPAASAATSTVPFTTCSDAPTFGCGHLTVPLDPTGAVPGTVTLAIRRKLAATGTATEAVVALAGGPGQAALPFATDAEEIMETALNTRDLIVFDQRGTGDSGALTCSAFSELGLAVNAAIPDCAAELGAGRGLYTTDDSVYDIEQIREALGYSKLVLFGTSYGTKVALRYAAEYPQDVAGLVLDSTVPPNGPPIFDESTYQAIPRILAQICAHGACPGIPDPLGDLEKVLARVEAHRVSARYYTGTGKRISVKIGPDAIANLLLAGDLDPVLRDDFPAAIHAAAALHYGSLAILIYRANVGAGAEDSGLDAPLYFATECEELPYPWDRADSAVQRYQQALAAAKAMPPGSFGPFDYKTAFDESNAPECAYWPFATTTPEATITSLPDVPTLIISGADDLRTPTSDARQVAAMIPDATVVVVPQTGHSTLETEFSTCGLDAVDAFFAGTPIQAACAPVQLPGYLQPAHVVPASMAAVAPVRGTRGRPGRTAHAVELTVEWAVREFDESNFETLIGSYNPALEKGLGGLHGGYAKVESVKSSKGTKSVVHFRSFSYVPGVTLSGSFAYGHARLKVRGTRAAAGTLVVRKANDFSGRLGGVRVSFSFPNSNASLRASSRMP